MKYQAAGVAVGLTLAGALTLRAQSGPSSIGREVSVPVHLRDGQEYSMPIAALLAHGQRLFNAVWTETIGTINGVFARLVDGMPLMRPRPPAGTLRPPAGTATRLERVTC